MDLNIIKVIDIKNFIENFKVNTLTELKEALDEDNIYGEHLQYRLVDNRIYAGLLTVDFVIPNNFTYSKTPISIHFDVEHLSKDGKASLIIKEPQLRTYTFNGWWKPKLILTECNIKTIDTEDVLVDYFTSPVPLELEDNVVDIYKRYKERVTELMELREFTEHLFNETRWDDIYNIANFQEIKKWECPKFSKNISAYIEFLDKSEMKYANEMLLADNVFNNFGKHILTKDIPEKYNLAEYKTLEKRVHKLLSDKELLVDIQKINTTKINIDKAQLEYDNEKNNLFHKIRNKYNIPLEELLVK